MFVDVEDYTKLRILGGTRDDAAGECFDKVARLLGMPYPGGAALDRAAQGGDPSRYPMPRPHLSGNPLDLSFSGLKTSAVNLIHNAGQKGEQIVIPDLWRRLLGGCVRHARAARHAGAGTDGAENAGRGGRRGPPTAASALRCSGRRLPAACAFACRRCRCAATTAR